MTTAVLVMAYGSPGSQEEILPYYTDVRRGRPPTAEQLAELESRYAAIGGLSPLTERTTAQIGALQHALEALAPGRFATYYGAKHARPNIEDAVARAAKDGATAVVGLVLAPHYARLSVGEYVARAAHAAHDHQLPSAFVERYGADPVLIEMLAERVRDALGTVSAATRASTEVVFTAHSLPAGIVAEGDRYPEELAETAALVAERVGTSRTSTAWQSAGRTPEPWLGPDICEHLLELKSSGTKAVVVCPAGFTSDHLEVLHDLDIVAARKAHELGLIFARTASLNDDPRLAGLLARRVVAQADTLR